MQRSKLEALLALAEAQDCRRVRLLGYFGQASSPCGNCDNCLHPPDTWDATEAAQKVLSAVYRFAQHSGLSFGAAHLIDVLRGKPTDKVRQHHHESLSTFGIGAELSEAHWRGVVRQLVALGHLQAEGEFGTLSLAPSAREVLRGQATLRLREPKQNAQKLQVASARRGLKALKVRSRDGAGDATGVAPSVRTHVLDEAAQALFDRLKAWRFEVARSHGLPAYVIFHDATLAQMAQERPQTLSELCGISGVGAKKLQAYGEEILREIGRAHV